METTGVNRLITISSAGVRHDDPNFALWYRCVARTLLKELYDDMRLMETIIRERSRLDLCPAHPPPGPTGDRHQPGPGRRQPRRRQAGHPHRPRPLHHARTRKPPLWSHPAPTIAQQASRIRVGAPAGMPLERKRDRWVSRAHVEERANKSQSGKTYACVFLTRLHVVSQKLLAPAGLLALGGAVVWLLTSAGWLLVLAGTALLTYGPLFIAWDASRSVRKPDHKVEGRTFVIDLFRSVKRPETRRQTERGGDSPNLPR
jgi:hypothetical protein